LGNIRPSFIKIRAIRLCEEYPDRFCPSEHHPVCTCDFVHDCVDCELVMEYDENRKLCENANNDSACKPVHQCKDCGKVRAYKEEQKCGSKKCKGENFSSPYSANGFTDAHLPHEDPFDHNKALVGQYTDVENKRMRNWIAGYITRYIQRRKD
jgi:ribosomal protein S17E